MTNLRAGLSALAVTAAITAGGVGAASAATHASHSHHPAGVPCATQQTQVDKAQAKLDALTAKFAAAKAKVKKDKRALAAAKGSQRGQAQKALNRDKAKKQHLAKAKKAQVQRLLHATQRLEKCLGGSSSTPSTSTSPSASTTPSVSAPASGSPSA